MGSIEIITFILQIFTICFGMYTLAIIYKQWKKKKNPVDLAVFILMFTLFQIRAIAIIFDQLGSYGIDAYAYLKIGNLSLLDVIYMTYGVVFGWFILYLYDFKRLYTLPVVCGVFIEAYIYVEDDRVPHNMFITYIALAAAIILLVNGIKNKNGISFGIFLGTMVGIPEFYLGLWWFTLIAPVIIFTCILLGVTGWYDEKIFYDRAKRKQMQNTWISRVVG